MKKTDQIKQRATKSRTFKIDTTRSLKELNKKSSNEAQNVLKLGSKTPINKKASRSPLSGQGKSPRKKSNIQIGNFTKPDLRELNLEKAGNVKNISRNFGHALSTKQKTTEERKTSQLFDSPKESNKNKTKIADTNTIKISGNNLLKYERPKSMNKLRLEYKSQGINRSITPIGTSNPIKAPKISESNTPKLLSESNRKFLPRISLNTAHLNSGDDDANLKENRIEEFLPEMSGALLLEAAEKKARPAASKIKVGARFRPLNKVEKELLENGIGMECCSLEESERSIFVVRENLGFKMDYVFKGETEQELVYQNLASGTIKDVLKGYNGTVIAYGQTGSGKTYTMFGPHLFNELRGIIPRAAEDIFSAIDDCQLDIEFDIRCSMLEIYKDKLSDLLWLSANDSGRSLPPILKIKENPQKGIYVERLTQECICCEDDMLDLIEEGREMRHVAATRANQESSRSHTLFIITVNKKYANDSEKHGVLNLVDLAGSEKVGKTGATGETLEEAKKINSSLSAIGNVIHALIVKSSHIPYRDSKLTRILQESLGGNYKTSLIVTCSNHSAHMEETISTLRFAQRARSIKNQVRINIKNSPQQLRVMIQQLKFELSKALKENEILKEQINGPKYELPTNSTSEGFPIKIYNKYLDSTPIPTIKEEPESKDKMFHNSQLIINDIACVNIKNVPNKTESINTQTIETIILEDILDVQCISMNPEDSSSLTELSLEESTTGDDYNEHGLLHNSPNKMTTKSSCRNIYIYIYIAYIVFTKVKSMISCKPKKPRQPSEVPDSIVEILAIEHDSNMQNIAEILDQNDIEFKELQKKRERKRERKELKNMVGELSQKNEDLIRQLEDAKKETFSYKRKAIGLQKTLDEFFEGKSLESYYINCNINNEGKFIKSVETLEATIESLRKELNQNEIDAHLRKQEGKEYLKAQLNGKVEESGLNYYMKLGDYMKNKKIPHNFYDEYDLTEIINVETPILCMIWEQMKSEDQTLDNEKTRDKMEEFTESEELYILRGELLEAEIYNNNLYGIVKILKRELEISRNEKNIESIINKCVSSNYRNLEEFLARTQNIQHRLRKRLEKAELELTEIGFKKEEFEHFPNNYLSERTQPLNVTNLYPLSPQRTNRGRITRRRLVNRGGSNPHAPSFARLNTTRPEYPSWRKNTRKLDFLGRIANNDKGRINGLTIIKENNILRGKLDLDKLADTSDQANSNFLSVGRQYGINISLEGSPKNCWAMEGSQTGLPIGINYDIDSSEINIPNSLRKISALSEIKGGNDSREDYGERTIGRGYLDFSEIRGIELKEEVELQTDRAEQMKAAYLDAREQIKILSQTIIQNEKTAKELFINETKNWQQICSKLKVRVAQFIRRYVVELCKKAWKCQFYAKSKTVQ